MNEIKDKIIISPDGIQRGKLSARPIPFNFEQEVLAGGGFDLEVARFINKMFMSELFPQPKGKSLFNWSELTPHLAVTIAANYHGLNQSLNKGAVSKGHPFIPINDDDISKKIAKSGVLSPNEVEVRFTPSRFRAN